ncbi:MAG TPA: hypothetical protein VE338_15925 [Ktedonobacterales bacterium]|nr:hypothetical protein [Ktedonobacterales bacterium]
MMIVRAPVRVSFGGGGTDLAAYYERYGGMVVSAAITRYCYAQITEPSSSVGSVTSADYGQRFHWTPERLPDVEPPLTLPKAALHEFAERGALSGPVTLALAADVPPGSGLGSSSAMAVAALQALSTRYEAPLSDEEVAARACALEIDRLGMPIGKQDQYASASGGMNAIEFTSDGVRVMPLRISPETRSALDRRLLLFWTNHAHDSASILRGQRADTQTRPDVVASLHEIKSIAHAMRAVLEAGKLDAFGRLLDDAWQTKRQLSAAISSNAIDEWYAEAKRAGALGGKITGAGGGGFLLIYARPERHQAVRAAMLKCSLTEMPFAFDLDGVRRLARAPLGWRQRFTTTGIMTDSRLDGLSAPIPCSA